MNYYMGIDNGLTSVKAVLFDERGNSLGVGEEKNHIDGVLIDAQALWEATVRCIRRAVEGFDSSKIKCIANSGHGNGLYAVKAGKGIYAASSMILGTDKYIDNADSDRIFDDTLQRVWPGQPAVIINWLKNKHKELYDDAEYFMFCKDYIKYMLTGTVTTDYSDASAGGLTSIYTGEYSKAVLEEFDIADIYDKLPRILKSTELAGRVTEEAADITGLAAGTLVAAGAFDVNSCVIGSAAFSQYGIICGTWGINSGLCDNAVRSKLIRQCCAFADGEKYISIDSAPTSAVNLEWFSNIIKVDSYASINELAAASNNNDIIYLPYIYEADIKGGFYGLSYDTEEGDMIKAVFEGVCFEHRRQIENLKRSGILYDGAVISGGAANSEIWMQLFADILNMPVTTVVEKQAGALGAAICAAVCAGNYKNLYDAAKNMVKIDRTYTPAKNHDKKYERYIKFINIVKELDV